MPPKLTGVIRLDSIPIAQTYYTEEGYLKDRPILTSTGIFEYRNPDGSVRRELRLPEDVFDKDSLESYKGKPIIITHDAGLVTKNNVHEHQIGTILTDGYRSGDDVRAEIIIHDTNEMKQCGLKELSLGYNLDLDEVPGEWNGQHYDAIQRNIRINHLALVREARAGEQARLNIDSRDTNTILKGGKSMSVTQKTQNARRADGLLSKEELSKAIEEYMARRAENAGEAKTDDGEPETKPVVSVDPSAPAADGDAAADEPSVENAETIEEKVQILKERQDEGVAPTTIEEATATIEKKDGDMNILFDIIDTLLSERDFGVKKDEGEAVPTVEGEEKENVDGEGEEAPTAEGGENADCDTGNADSDEDGDGNDDNVIPKTPAAVKSTSTMNADAVDSIVRQRIQLGMIGRTLNMDGLENMSISEAKKAVIMAVRPSLRLDGKSDAYINAAYDYAVSDVKASTKKDIGYQKKQMFNKDSRSAKETDSDSAENARQKMIDKMNNRNSKK